MDQPDRAWRLGHRPGLDAVRGFAALAVIADHTQVPGFEVAGQVGVAVFFVLSGFLITARLIEEHAERGRVDLPGFYLRRVRRLAPALVVAVAVVGVVSAGTLRDGATGLTFVSNWGPAGGGSIGVWHHAWSLAVEEQFYLLWPAAFVVLGGAQMGRRVWWVGGVAATSFAVGWTMSEVRAYYGTDARLYSLAVGALLAIGASRGMRVRVPIWVIAPPLVAAGLFPLSRQSIVMLSTVGAALWIVWLLDHEGVTARPAVWVGKRSYAIYLWHYPLTFLVPAVWPVKLLIVSLATGVLAEVSWRMVEAPALRLGQLHDADIRGVVHGAPAVDVSLDVVARG